MMRNLILLCLLVSSYLGLPGQDSLFLASGEVIEGDILIFHKDWIVIRPHGTKHPVEIARKGTTYRLGEDYLVRSPWSIGFRYGRTFWGTRHSLYGVFEDHGFILNDPFYTHSPFDPRRSPVIQVELEYALNKRAAIGSAIGFLNSGQPSGSKLFPDDEQGYVNVKHRTWSIAPYYKWFSNNRSLNFSGGPTLGFNRLNYIPVNDLSFETPVTLGVSVGAEYSIVEKRRSFLRLSVQYQWAPAISFGPLGRMEYDYSAGEPVGEFYEYLPRTKVRASYLTLSAIYGRKFGRK